MGKFRRPIVVTWAVLVLIVSEISSIAPSYSAKTSRAYITTAVKVNVNLWERHGTYGVFFVPVGRVVGSLHFHFYNPDKGTFIRNAGVLCGSAGANGDLDGLRVPEGFIGIKGCLGTAVSWSVKASDPWYALYDPKLWVLECT